MKVFHIIWKRGCGNEELSYTVWSLMGKDSRFMDVRKLDTDYTIVYPVKSNVLGVCK